MSRKAAPARAKQGDTTAEVLENIRLLEAEQNDWNEHTLADRCGLSAQHVRNILKTLTFNGTLQYQDDVVVKKRRLVLTEPGPKSSRAA